MAEIANYLGHGNERSDYPDGGWSWNVLSVKVSRYKIKIIQDRDIISNKISAGGFIYTSDVEIFGVKEFMEGKRIVNDICRILSFASFSQVAPFSYSFKGRVNKINGFG